MFLSNSLFIVSGTAIDVISFLMAKSVSAYVLLSAKVSLLLPMSEMLHKGVLSMNNVRYIAAFAVS